MKKISYLFIIIGLLNIMTFSNASDIAPSPPQALQKLKDGNKRFLNNKSIYPNLNNLRRDLTSKEGQFPFATIISCSDSRVPVEHIFDAGIGDVFVIRVAGNVCNVDEIGSIEYGVEHLSTPIFVVMGHSGCGAVTAVVKGLEVHGSIPALVSNIYPAVEKAKIEHGDHFSDELLTSAIELNVWQSIEDLLNNSHGTLELVKSGKLKIVGAVYNLTSGEVQWLGEHPHQESLLTSNVHDNTRHLESKEEEFIVAKGSNDVDTSSESNYSIKETGKIKTIIIIIIVFIGLVYILLLNKKTALKLKLRAKILSIAIVLILMMIGVGIVSYIYMKSIGDELYSIAEEDIVLSNKVSAIEAHQLEQSIIVEQILKNTHNNSINSFEKERIIKELKTKFIHFSSLTDKELIEAEEICKKSIAHEKKEKTINEFQDKLKVLIRIEKEHTDFEKEVENLLKSISSRNILQISEHEQIIEKELEQINYEVDSLLQAIQHSTAVSAVLAEAHEKEAIKVNFLLIIVGILIGFILSYTLSSLITVPIIKTVEFAGKIANGDLTQTLKHDQDDEVGEMVQALTRMVEKLKYIVAEIITGSNNIASASQQISSSSQELSQGANEQASSVEEVSSTMEQIAANIEQNTENAGLTEKTAAIATQGIRDVSNQSNETVSANKLISEKINIITDIAFQTNILALNAAVEAARAGEHGKGFAVVAAEVRKLAERSKDAAGEIVGLAKNSLELAERAGKKMQDILPEVVKTTQLVQEISSASLEQNNGATQVNGAIQQLNSVIQQYAASSEELATSSEEMNGQAEQLKDMIGFFKTEENSKSNSGHSSKHISSLSREKKGNGVNTLQPDYLANKGKVSGKYIKLPSENDSDFEQY